MIKREPTIGASEDNGFHATGTWFKNLTGLRFFAAAAVVFVHTEQAKSLSGFSNIWKNKGIYELGDKAVTLFFVLSGFLITYLLLQEKKATKTVAVKQFYLRRILRIWPLYYLIVLLALFVLPAVNFFHWGDWSDYLHDHFINKCILFLLILPNVSQVIYPVIPFGNQLWSIGVEEQFYIFWPLIIKYLKNALPFLIGIIIGMPLLISFLFFASNHWLQAGTAAAGIVQFLKQFLSLTRIDCMALGGLAAYCLFLQKNKLLAVIFHPATQVINFIAIGLILYFGFYLPFVNNILHGLTFGILILNLAANKQSLISLEWKPLHFLGKISFGIYMYHPICIFLCMKLITSLNLDAGTALPGLALYLLTYACTILLAALSYKFFETPFLKLKPFFSRKASGLIKIPA
jgi:peptidoglycan/LPS O-acetylase OafA/YrhL